MLFRSDLELFGRHAAWMAGHGCAAIVTPGSLGEGGLLTLDEKRSLWSRAVESVPDSVPVVAAVGACGTREAEGIARAAEECGCRGLMVLPPYAYAGDWRETRAHFARVITLEEIQTLEPAVLHEVSNPRVGSCKIGRAHV